MEPQGQEVSRETWTQFFDEWSRSHRGQSAALQASGPDIGDEEAAKGMVSGITADQKDGENTITILFGGDPPSDEHVSYGIANPKTVSDTGSGGLSIATEDGSTYTLKLS